MSFSIEAAPIEALRVEVEHWKARALVAERASEQKERLLNLLTDAAKRNERTIMAVSLVVGPNQPIGMSIHTGDPVTEELLSQWAGTIAPWLRVIDAIAREHEGRALREAAESMLDDD